MFRTKTTPQNFMPQRDIDALGSYFSEHELSQLATLSTPVEVKAGTQLTIEGTLGQQALVLVEGTASVLRGDSKIATVKAGDIIGEIALISGEARTATVVTDVDSVVYALSPREFASLLTNCPRLEARITTIALERLTTV